MHKQHHNTEQEQPAHPFKRCALCVVLCALCALCYAFALLCCAVLVHSFSFFTLQLDGPISMVVVQCQTANRKQRTEQTSHKGEFLIFVVSILLRGSYYDYNILLLHSLLFAVAVLSSMPSVVRLYTFGGALHWHCCCSFIVCCVRYVFLQYFWSRDENQQQ